MKNIFTILLSIIIIRSFCQVGGISISPNSSLPDPSAMLDVSATNKGFLMPRITQAQRDLIGSPALGLEIYNTTDNCIEVYGFSNWQTVSCLCSGAPSAPSTITGNNNPCANASNITYTVGLVLGANTYTWTVPPDATIIAGQGTNSITVNFGSNGGSVAVTANNSCGISSPSMLAISIDSIPSTPGAVNGNPYPCANSVAQAYNVAVDSGATSYAWSVPSGSIVTAGQGTNSILVNFYSTPGSLAVTANNACGSSSASALPISMAITPSSPGAITGDTTFTDNQSGLAYSIAPVTEATTYTWTVPADAVITSGQGTDSITVTFGGASGYVCVTAGNCAGTSANNSCLKVTNTCYAAGSQTFNYTGGQQTFTVPCGVGAVNISAYGAQGSSGNGGYGGLAAGTWGVVPNNILYVFAGGQSGFNGGGTGGESSSNGGGESDVRQGGTSISNWILVAGGGGGGSANGGNGGAGGGGIACQYGAGGGGGTSGDAGNGAVGTCTSGGPAGSTNGGWSGGGGGGGLTSGGGGTANAYSNTAGSGTQGQGGNAGSNNSCGCCGSGNGCGGGGGYYGGGGSSAGQCAAGCGGGGSSWIAAGMSNISFAGGIQSGNGQVVITW